MGPTCSIVYENEPMEKGTMNQKPRKITETFLSWKELNLSILQGLIIAAGVLFAYHLTAQKGGDEETTRAMVFTTLIFANILLSLTNRSFTYSIFETLKYKNKLFSIVIGSTLVLLFAILYIPIFADFFHLVGLRAKELATALVIASISVLWIEGYKWMK